MVSDFEQEATNASYLYNSAFITFATPPDDGNTTGLRWRGCHNSAASFVSCAAGFPPSPWRAVMKLPEIQAKRIYARYYLGMTVNEIAEVEGVDPSRVRDSIRRGLKQLGKYF